MELDNFNNNCKEPAELSTLNINIEIFEQIKDKIIFAFQQLGISSEGMSIYYQRHSNSASILAIKVSTGDDNDISNYMVNASVVDYHHNDLSCDIYLHSAAKSSRKAVDISNLISKDIISFFETLEKYLLTKKLTDIELYLRIPLNVQNKKTDVSKEHGIKKLIRSLTRRKK